MAILDSFTIGILSLIIGAGCFYIPRTEWFDNIMVEKYQGEVDDEEVEDDEESSEASEKENAEVTMEDRIAKEKNTLLWMGFFWVVFGFMQLVIGM